MSIEAAAIGGYDKYLKEHESQCLVRQLLQAHSTRRYDAQTGVEIEGEPTTFASDEILGAVSVL
jgi:hypothetical protein